MFSLSLLHFVGHVLELRSTGLFFSFLLSLKFLVFLDQLFRTARPGALTQDLLNILTIDNLFVEEQLSDSGMTLFVFGEDLFGAFILLVDDLEHLVVNDLRSCLAVRTLERILIVIIIADVGQAVAHTRVSYHTKGSLRAALQVVHGTRRDRAYEKLLRSPSAEERTDLVELLLLGCDNTLLRNVPSSAKRLTTRHDGDFNQRVGIFAEPTDRCVSGFMDSDGTLLFSGHHLRLLFQSAYDTVYGIEEILLSHSLAVMSCGNQCCLVADVGNVSAGESRGLTCEEVDIDVFA